MMISISEEEFVDTEHIVSVALIPGQYDMCKIFLTDGRAIIINKGIHDMLMQKNDSHNESGSAQTITV